ncbi:MAG: hypothetical protein HC799_05460 [Limnothrix sp. RL_2_0]|nr:hypothetical protein [Limnothrix sp. RL_2_0]
MNMKPIHRAIAPILLSAMLLLTACDTTAPSPVGTDGSTSNTGTTETAKTSEAAPPATTPTESAAPTETPTAPASSMKDIAGLPPQKGAAFNKFFPDGTGSDYDTVFTQEKEGFAEIKLTMDGTEMAKISISDTVTNLTARSKFEGATDAIDGFPAIAQGKKASAVLVGDRYQVKVMSRDDAFTEADRKAWLAKVDLTGLSKL